MSAKRIVITGGPSTGKTSVIEELERTGHLCLHEVIRAMTLQEKTEGENVTMVTNPIISVSDPMQFNLKVLNARIAQFNDAIKAKSEIVFFDRGIPDVLAYMDCFAQSYDSLFKNACDIMRYDHVFLMPPWAEIHVNDNERFESFEESLRIYDCLKTSYENFSYEVIIVPKGSVSKRIDFIMNHLKMD